MSLYKKIPEEYLVPLKNRLSGIIGITEETKKEALIALLSEFYELLNKYNQDNSKPINNQNDEQQKKKEDEMAKKEKVKKFLNKFISNK